MPKEDITDKLVTYDTAILAKEKGFNVPVLYGVYGPKMKLTREASWNLSNWNVKTKQQKNSKATSIPTQTRLQKWLYDKHQIWVNSRPLYSSNEQLGIQIDISSWKIPFSIIEEEDQFDVYAGLEKGLQEALKLIQ